jgi:ectoine hydroxylase-related dioxygenase (phytanoyl-CoA dioxygenase family)
MKDYKTDPRALNLPLVFSPFFEQLIASSGLSGSDVQLARHYREHGYVVLEDPVVSEETIDRVLADLEGRYDGFATGYDVPSRKQDAWHDSEAVAALAHAPRAVDLLSRLYGRRAFPFQTLNFRMGTQQHAHSDTVHFHSVPQNFMAGVWVALEDIHPDSGPLVIYPGSHTLPVLDPFDLNIDALWSCYLEYEEAMEAVVAALELEPHDVILERGQAVVWAANLIHGGSAVRDPQRTRLSQVTHYYFDDCVYYQPAVSDPFMGKLAMKEVEEVGTRRLVPNLYRGRPAEEWLQAKTTGILARLLRRA